MQPVPVIPGFELIKCLGGGPLTTVWSARDGSDDSPCAVKVLRGDWANQPAAIKLLQREARAGLLVKHPHLIEVRHVHVTRPPYFLIMELLPGESLQSRLRRDYQLDVPTTIWIARQTAEALVALHRAGFIHGDIKTDNVRLVDSGTAVLIDLGFTHRPGENRSFFESGYILGTADYLAPELCEAEPTDEPAGDLFSLGVMLFEMLAGRLPYPKGTVQQTFRRHLCDPPADLRRHAPLLPTALVTLIERLLSRRPADRPTAAAVVKQLVALEIAAIGRRKSA